MIEPKTVSLVIFIMAYVLFVLLPQKRTIVAICAAILTVLLGAIPPRRPFLR